MGEWRETSGMFRVRKRLDPETIVTFRIPTSGSETCPQEDTERIFSGAGLTLVAVGDTRAGPGEIPLNLGPAQSVRCLIQCRSPTDELESVRT